MHFLKKISLIQYRNYPSASFSFEGRVTCICGLNGSGKTNLLDAIYYLCYTKSYFTSSQQSCAMTGTDGFRVTGSFTEGDTITAISCKWQAGKKELFTDNVLCERITDHIGKYAAVMIAPDDTELLNGSSEGRRKWIDGILSQSDKSYFDQLLLYHRVLQQRNAWLKAEALKSSGRYDEMAYYDAVLHDCGSYLYQKRALFLAQLMPDLTQLYDEITGGREEITATYFSDIADASMHELLHKHLENDLRLQRTTKGIHRDDIAFFIGGLPAKQFASQGQKKSLLFAMKLAQFTYLTSTLGYQPMLLLDDIFEKLDQSRMDALMHMMAGNKFGQVFLTDTHADRVSKTFGKQDHMQLIAL